MQISEKNIEGKLLRIIIINYQGNNPKMIEGIKQKIMKRNIYFDFIVVYHTKKLYSNSYRHSTRDILLYNNRFQKIEIENNQNWYSYESIIRKFITSKSYKNEIRSKKLEKILA